MVKNRSLAQTFWVQPTLNLNLQLKRVTYNIKSFKKFLMDILNPKKPKFNIRTLKLYDWNLESRRT